MEKTPQTIIPSMLTAVSAPPTKELPISTQDWANWLRVRTHQDPKLENMVNCCARFVRRLRAKETPPSWLSLMGNTGTGKTHCARNIWNRHVRGMDWTMTESIPKVCYWPAMIRDLRNGLRHEQIRDMACWPLLLLDDIGAERDTTGFAAEQLNTLLGCRERKWTILTSNLNLEQLAKIDPRIADRIIRGEGNEYAEVNTISYALRIRNG